MYYKQSVGPEWCAPAVRRTGSSKETRARPRLSFGFARHKSYDLTLKGENQAAWIRTPCSDFFRFPTASKDRRILCHALEQGPDSSDTEIEKKRSVKKKRRAKDRPWWDLTKYTGQERALLAGITFLLLLFGPRILVLLLAFFERGIVAFGLVVETALVNIFIATFKWVAIGAGVLIIGGLIYFLQLEQDRLDKQ
eukprot:jgi/Botrbrau1/2436/Bobra.0395s0057.1